LDSDVPFDPAFDFREEARDHRTGKNRDPDRFSSTLREYHRRLWSKPLPGGDQFGLSKAKPGAYLHHRSSRGEFSLASDSAVPTFITYRRMKHIIREVPAAEKLEFDTITYQMGGMMLFPGNRIEGKKTINGARGCHPRIADRLDLTVECIRLHYLGETSPLAEALNRYRDFFVLFEDFAGYVDFFLLQDLASADRTAVHLFLPFKDFESSPLPGTLDAFRTYRDRAVTFVEARSRRMVEYLAGS
jgi:hypothetical protein